MKKPGLISKIGKRRGSIMIMTAMAAVFMLGMTAMVTDVGFLYYNQARLQTAVNAGWKAGYDRMSATPPGQPLSVSQQQEIQNHVREVMMANGFTAEELSQVQIDIVESPQGRRLDVRAKHDVGLFFARILNFESAQISAAREAGESTAMIVPLAIPHGVVKDLSKKYYDIELFDADSGFKADEEYIIKLGSGEGKPDQSALLVPMGVNDQPSTNAYRLAYGAAFWCLQIDDSDISHFAPIYWLLGYRGGAFLLQDAPAVRAKLSDYGVRFEVKKGQNEINQIFQDVGEHVMEIHKRPRVAVYSSTTEPDPVEEILRNSRIPYGPYALPPNTGGWKRNENFNANRCSSFYDEGILAGEVDKYHWLHLHHEDFTGFSGGCLKWKNAPENNSTDPDCKANYEHKDKIYGSTGNAAQRTAAREYFCDYCYSMFDPSTGNFSTGSPDQTINNIGDSSTKISATFHGTGKSVLVKVTTSKKYIYNITLTYVDNTTQSVNYSGSTTQATVPSSPNKVIQKISVQAGTSSSKKYYYADNPVTPQEAYEKAKCRHYKRRCAEFASHQWWEEYERVKPAKPGPAFDQYLYRNSPNSKVKGYICYSDDTRPNCRGYVRAYDIATEFMTLYPDKFNFNDESNAVPKPQASVNDAGTLKIGLQEQYWFDSGNRVQLMKWEVARIVKNHLLNGGFLFAQCFAPETFDMALFQRGIHLGMTPTQAYKETLAFKDFTYAAMPLGKIPLKFSTINTREYDTKQQPFTLSYPYDPRTQNHGSNPDTKTGHTASFLRSTIKTDSNIKILGVRTNDSTYVKYVGGEIGEGVFSYLGGHYHDNIQAERLVLNNILFGSTSTKEVSEGPEGIHGGRRKYSYGPVDPDNTFVEGDRESNYSERFRYGFNEPLQLNDRINNEPDANMASETQSVVDYRLLAGARRVIVPITDLGPEIADSASNSTAISLYDLQGRDNANGVYDPQKFGFEASVRIIGFAEFEIIPREEYQRAGIERHEDGSPVYDTDGNLTMRPLDMQPGDVGDLGGYQTGQVRGRFIRYIVDPHEVESLLN